MKALWKFPLITVEQRITAPGLTRMVHVAKQYFDGHTEVCVWGEVDTTAEPRSCIVLVHGTSHHIGDDEHYIGTIHEPPYVYHYFATEPTA